MDSESILQDKENVVKGCLKLNDRNYPIYNGLNTIGRNPDAIVNIKNLNISQQHAVITVVDENCHFISDFKSSNGTMLNNAKLKPLRLYKLENGASIKFADIFCTYKKLNNNESMVDQLVESQKLSESFYVADTQTLEIPIPPIENDFNEMPTQAIIPINELPTQIFEFDRVAESKVDETKSENSNDSIDFMTMQKMSESQFNNRNTNSDEEPSFCLTSITTSTQVLSDQAMIQPVKLSKSVLNSDDEEQPISQICPVKTSFKNLITSDSSDTEEYPVRLENKRKSRYVISDDSETDIEEADEVKTDMNDTRDQNPKLGTSSCDQRSSVGSLRLEISEITEEKEQPKTNENHTDHIYCRSPNNQEPNEKNDVSRDKNSSSNQATEEWVNEEAKNGDMITEDSDKASEDLETISANKKTEEKIGNIQPTKFIDDEKQVDSQNKDGGSNHSTEELMAVKEQEKRNENLKEKSINEFVEKLQTNTLKVNSQNKDEDSDHSTEELMAVNEQEESNENLKEKSNNEFLENLQTNRNQSSMNENKENEEAVIENVINIQPTNSVCQGNEENSNQSTEELINKEAVAESQKNSNRVFEGLDKPTESQEIMNKNKSANSEPTKLENDKKQIISQSKNEHSNQSTEDLVTIDQQEGSIENLKKKTIEKDLDEFAERKENEVANVENAINIQSENPVCQDKMEDSNQSTEEWVTVNHKEIAKRKNENNEKLVDKCEPTEAKDAEDSIYIQPTQQINLNFKGIVKKSVPKVKRDDDDIYSRPTQQLVTELKDDNQVQPNNRDDQFLLPPTQAMEILHNADKEHLSDKNSNSSEVEEQLEMLFATQSKTFKATQQLVEVLEDDEIIDDSLTENFLVPSSTKLSFWNCFKKPKINSIDSLRLTLEDLEEVNDTINGNSKNDGEDEEKRKHTEKPKNDPVEEPSNKSISKTNKETTRRTSVRNKGENIQTKTSEDSPNDRGDTQTKSKISNENNRRSSRRKKDDGEKIEDNKADAVKNKTTKVNSKEKTGPNVQSSKPPPEKSLQKPPHDDEGNTSRDKATKINSQEKEGNRRSTRRKQDDDSSSNVQVVRKSVIPNKKESQESDNDDKSNTRRASKRKKDKDSVTSEDVPFKKPVDDDKDKNQSKATTTKKESQENDEEDKASNMRTTRSKRENVPLEEKTPSKSKKQNSEETKNKEENITTPEKSKDSPSSVNTRKRTLRASNVDADSTDEFASDSENKKNTISGKKTDVTIIPTPRKSARTRKNQPEVISIPSSSSNEVISISSLSSNLSDDEPSKKVRRLSANSRRLKMEEKKKEQKENQLQRRKTAVTVPQPIIISTPERSKRQLKPKVVFTMMENPELESLIRQLGGSVVDTVDACTVLVTESVKRSQKLLCAVGQGKPICSPQWLEGCKKARSFLDPWEYILIDEEAEKKWNFSLRESLNRSTKSKLLDNYTFQLIVDKAADVLKGAIESCGGKCVTRNLAKSTTDHLMIVSSQENRNKYSKIVKQNAEIKVVEAEAIFDGTLRQEFKFNQFLLT